MSPLAFGTPAFGRQRPLGSAFGMMSERGSVLPQMTPKLRRRSPSKPSKMVTKRKTKRGRRKTRTESSNSCSTLQMGASQVLGWGGGQRAGVAGVKAFLTAGSWESGQMAVLY